ncbi:uncharacterized protein [Bemisia tabaci]|uniref:uncharacterized protein isoform X2 n=1 Tax=Bemisia tabaci TaxID=7038 RepID=UPI003B288941
MCVYTLFLAVLTLNAVAETIDDSSQEEISPGPVHFGSHNSDLDSKELEPPEHSSTSSLISSGAGTISQSNSDAREAKSISYLNMRLSAADSSEFPARSKPEFLPTPIKAWSEPSSTEIITTYSHDSYLIDETSNTSTSTHAIPDRNTVAYSVDSFNATEASQNPYSSSTEPVTSSGPFVTISKININKVHKNKIPEEKILKKNATNSINGITLKKILASNKTKQQQVQSNSSAEAVNSMNTSLSTSEFKDVDHTSYQNDSPATENKTTLLNHTTEAAHGLIPVVQPSNIVPVVPVKNETDDDLLFGSNETSASFNRSAENASFSTLNERIVAPDETTLSSFNIIVIVVISATVVALTGLIGAVSFVMYRRYRWNKPQTLSDKCSNADSSGYIDDSTLRENSEEMYSLDNDSFLNSLEAMTIQNYWTDVKHTKL